MIVSERSPYTSSSQKCSKARLTRNSSTRAIARDETAVRALIQRYNRRLYRVARSVVADDGRPRTCCGKPISKRCGAWKLSRRVHVGDVASPRRPQRGLSALAPPSTFRFRTSIRAAATHRWRTSFHFRLRPAPQLIRSAPWRNQSCRLVERAIDALPREFRAVLVARVVEGMSVEETAAAFDLLPGDREDASASRA